MRVAVLLDRVHLRSDGSIGRQTEAIAVAEVAGVQVKRDRVSG
jgi:hypothetical protein